MGETKIHDPETMRKSGKGLSETGEKTHEAWSKLKSYSDGLGDIFGDDMVGGLIGGAYGAVMQLADESFTSAADDYKAFGEGLTKAGDHHAETEKRNTELLTRLGSQIDSISGGK